ncbi:hypothetical protein ACFFP0_24635 [Rhizobium puerariae]|uniref:Uncharacterized protein n=1 Tax=Rhizobium puerariae TaxID=1585791 RepID=A0ABV6AQQ1_9HYPH
MNQNVALRFDDLSEETAAAADASFIVKARFVEAADTMRHIDIKGIRPAVLKAFWPEHAMEYNEIRLRYRPSAIAISRAEEVMYGWMLDFVRDEERRTLIGRWSMCMAAPHIAGSFRDFCRTTNRIRRTAERRLLSEFHHVSSEIIKNAQSLHEPDWARVSPMMPNSGSDLHKIRTPLVRYQLHDLPDENRPVNDPQHPDRIALIKRLERANRRRKRKQAA